MANGFRDYVWECVGEVPSAFRRGMIVVTIAANAAVVAALSRYSTSADKDGSTHVAFSFRLN
jgi:hypothetical protein